MQTCGKRLQKLKFVWWKSQEREKKEIAMLKKGFSMGEIKDQRKFKWHTEKSIILPQDRTIFYEQ